MRNQYLSYRSFVPILLISVQSMPKKHKFMRNSRWGRKKGGKVDWLMFQIKLSGVVLKIE